MSDRITLFDTATPLLPLRKRIDSAIGEVVAGGRFILGPQVSGFEREFAAAIGSTHAVGVANGTDALELALRAVGVGPGDEVVVPSLTFYATAEAVVPTGAVPVFCDVDSDTACITAETVKAAVTPRTKAVVAVNLFGNVADVPALEALGVTVVEDAAQAAGSTLGGRPAGSLGTAASFSFFPSKNLGCFGDGGAVTTSDDGVAEMVRTLRFHGSKDKRSFEYIGRNSRLDEIQAAVLSVLLPSLTEWTEGRRAAAAAYTEAGLADLPGVEPIRPTDGADPAWHLLVVRHERADELAVMLDEAGIEARGYYRVPVHRQPAMADWGGRADLPATDQLARTNLALPISSVFEAGQARRVVEALEDAISRLD